MTTVRAIDDGLGVRRIETDSRGGGLIEVLEIAPALAAQPMFEAAVRQRVARFADINIAGVVSPRRVDREGAILKIVTPYVDGLRLPELMHEAVKGNIPLPQPAALELAGQIIHTVSLLHQLPGGLMHGAITPAHVVITRDGRAVLTDTVFGPAIEALERNREQLWREFRVTMPASANLPRFDQRADIAQLGGTVLAIALGRCLRADEYPRSVNEIVIAATLAARPGETGTSASALRMWLQQALFLHPRVTMNTAVDAERAYAEVLAPAAARRGGPAALQSGVRRIFGDTPASAEAARVAEAWSAPNVIHRSAVPINPPDVLPAPYAPPQDDAPGPLSSIFRSVFPNFRAN